VKKKFTKMQEESGDFCLQEKLEERSVPLIFSILFFIRGPSISFVFSDFFETFLG
jgi:hypothetical protein